MMERKPDLGGPDDWGSKHCTGIKGEEGLVEGQLSQANHFRRPKGESTCVANLR